MEDFTIVTRITTKEYIKIMYIGLYKKPVFIFATLLGIFLLTTVILDHLNVITYYSTTPWYEIILGVFLLISPSLITLIAARQFTSNPGFQKEIKYTFGETGLILQGVTFKNELSWAHIIKQKEISNYLVLYTSKKLGTFINKSLLTTEQIEFIKSKINLH